MSLEMAHKVILPPQKNYIPQFLKQRDINSYYTFALLNVLNWTRTGSVTQSLSAADLDYKQNAELTKSAPSLRQSLLCYLQMTG
jgi:hypothetical protein